MSGTVEAKINKKLNENVMRMKEYLKNIVYSFEN